MQTLNATISQYLDAHASIMDCFVEAVIDRLPGHIADELRASLERDDANNVDPNQPTSNIVRQINRDARFLRVALTDLARTQTAEEVTEAWVDLAAKGAQTAWETTTNVVALSTAKSEA